MEQRSQYNAKQQSRTNFKLYMYNGKTWTFTKRNCSKILPVGWSAERKIKRDRIELEMKLIDIKQFQIWYERRDYNI